jgi:hypothetical protein
MTSQNIDLSSWDILYSPKRIYDRRIGKDLEGSNRVINTVLHTVTEESHETPLSGYEQIPSLTRI